MIKQVKIACFVVHIDYVKWEMVNNFCFYFRCKVEKVLPLSGCQYIC